MQNLKEKIQSLQKECLEALARVTNQTELEQVRVSYLGRNGKIAELMPALKELSLEDKRTIGPLMNHLKQTTQQAFEKKKELLDSHQHQTTIDAQRSFDVTAYLPGQTQGSLHPITILEQHIENIFISMGYDIARGPEVETEYYNFEALNIPQDHPARDMWDTFWLDIPGLVLRTHTSNVQIHTMEKQELPLAVACPGRVYRHEATDATHDFQFNQCEGLLIDKDISMAHLLGTVKQFFRALFNQKNLEIRVRPSYFPFVEPGIEIDISCPFCKNGCSVCKRTQWIELGGAGLVHPNVLECSKINANRYSGFAFGFGLDRIAMMYYHINDIRLFTSGNIEFLKQF